MQRSIRRCGSNEPSGPSQVMLTRQVRRRFVRNRLGQIGVVICLVVVAVVITAPWIGRYDPAALGAGDPLAAPSWTHWFGTDELGRDVFARVAYAARIALYVAVASTAFAALVGIPLGLASGYYGGWIDSIMMRVTDAWLAFPIMVLALGMTAAI